MVVLRKSAFKVIKKIKDERWTNTRSCVGFDWSARSFITSPSTESLKATSKMECCKNIFASIYVSDDRAFEYSAYISDVSPIDINTTLLGNPHFIHCIRLEGILFFTHIRGSKIRRRPNARTVETRLMTLIAHLVSMTNWKDQRDQARLKIKDQLHTWHSCVGASIIRRGASEWNVLEEEKDVSDGEIKDQSFQLH